MLTGAFRRMAAGLRGSLTRYPFYLLSAATAAVLAIACIHEADSLPVSNELLRWLHLNLVAVPLALLLDLRWQTRSRLATGAAVVLLLVFAWFSLGQYPRGSSFSELIVVAWILCGLLLLSLFASKETLSGEGWWEGFKDGVTALCGAVIYAVVLFVALVLVREALVHLFQVSQPGFDARDLAAICFLPGVALFFTALLPADWTRRTTTNAPAYLPGLLGFLLFPVSALFVVVLYAYLSRILILQEWPRGWVSNLVFSLSTCALAAWLTSYPYRHKRDLWWQRLRRWLMPVLIAPLIAQLMSISLRIQTYDWTIPRYLGLSLGIWLMAVALYYSFVREARIRWLPASALVLVVWVSFSPWNAHRTSIRAQKERLVATLGEAGLLDTAGRIVPPAANPETLPDSLVNVLADQLGWLWQEGRQTALDGLLPEACLQQMQDRTDSLGSVYSSDLLQVLSRCTAIDFTRGIAIQPAADEMPFFISRDIFQGGLSVGISGYDHLVGLTASATGMKSPPSAGPGEWRASLSGDSVIIFRRDTRWGSAATGDWLGVLSQDGVYQGRWPDSIRPLQVRSDLGEHALLVPEQMQGSFRENRSVVLRELRAYLLLKN